MNSGVQLVSLGGLPGQGPTIQALIKTQLLGVDLTAFSPGFNRAEAVVRSDPGASRATLTFIKSGQTLSLPLDLAQSLIGPSSGSAEVAVEILGRGSDNLLSASLRLLSAPKLEPASTLASSRFSSESGIFSATGSLLSKSDVAILVLTQSKAWSNTTTQLLDVSTEAAALAPSVPSPEAPKLQDTARATPQIVGHLELAMEVLPAGAGVGFERALARIEGMGPEMAQTATEALSRFPQTHGAQSPDFWIAQQARAQQTGEILWAGRAWAGAPAELAWGAGTPTTEAGTETLVRCGVDGSAILAWMRCKIEPAGLGPIDLWATLLRAGRCVVRLRARPEARAAMERAKIDFAHLLSAASVDLSISTEAAQNDG